QAAVAGGVAAVPVAAEHAPAHRDHLGRLYRERLRQLVAGVLRKVLVLAHPRSSPFISIVGIALSAASSAARAAATRSTPSGIFWISSCSLMIASISISGRGGQPGR